MKFEFQDLGLSFELPEDWQPQGSGSAFMGGKRLDCTSMFYGPEGRMQFIQLEIGRPLAQYTNPD